MRESENCIKVIDDIHRLAHEGAFENIDDSILESATAILSCFLDVKVNLTQASKLFNMHKSAISNHVSRKAREKDKFKNHRLIKLSFLKKILGK